MKFKKSTRYFNRFVHYTPSFQVKSILDNGLMKGVNTDFVSGFDGVDDHIHNDQYNFKKIYNTDFTGNDGKGNFRLKPDNKYLAQMSTVDKLRGFNQSIEENRTPMRIVVPYNTNENGRSTDKEILPYAGTDYNESGYIPKSEDKNDLLAEIPFGAVTKNNYNLYQRELKDIDSSKFNVDDTYTRRMYNLWAKKNNKPLLPGSEKYR